MDNRTVLKLCSFLSFLFSYLWGMVFLLYQQDFTGLLIISLICVVSIILFLYSYFRLFSLAVKKKNM